MTKETNTWWVQYVVGLCFLVNLAWWAAFGSAFWAIFALASLISLWVNWKESVLN